MILNSNFDVPTTRELFKCLSNKGEWNLKSPFRKWLHLYGVGKSLCNVIKMTAYKEDQKLSWFAYYPLVYVSVHLILVLYTIAYYILNGEFYKFLPCTCIFVGPICGVWIRESHRYFNGIDYLKIMNLYFQTMPVAYIVLSKQRYILHDFLAFPGRYIYPDNIEDEGEEYYDICSKQMDTTIKRFLSKLAILTGSVIIASFWPIYLIIVQDVKVTRFQLKFPHIKEDSYSEYVGNSLLECNILGHGALAYLAVEVGLDIIFDFVVISQKLLEYRLKKLFNQYKMKPSTSDVICTLGNIIQHLRKYDEYNRAS